MRLYPPIIEGTIPAFYGTELVVPFSMNKTVGYNQVNGFALKIKTVQSNNYIVSISTLDLQDNDIQYIFDPYTAVTFRFSKEIIKKFNVGQYYKIQLAYINGEDVGYYSTVGIVKYTQKPSLTIAGLQPNDINRHEYRYSGIYSQLEKDVTEKVYSYEFNIYDLNNNIVKTSGVLLHNSSHDTEIYESSDTWICEQDLNESDVYFIQYSVKTTNNLVARSPKYRIKQQQSITPNLQAELKATANYNDGYIQLTLKGAKSSEGNEIAETGQFSIVRSSEDDDFKTWHEILKFAMYAQKPSRWIWNDFTVEQGKKYKYAIQQYNDYGIYSSRKETEEIFADFEDMFLFDGERQLKIKFNPKVSSFKNTIQEAKLETIGNQYPYIFRNGAIKYKEFPVAGLISYQMDDQNLFYNLNIEDWTLNLTSDNMANERKFKLEVLNWLTNGKPKLFRSPNEGNYIIRLLNTSLSPIDSLGRMLHSFTSTAYEIDKNTYESQKKYGFIQVIDPSKTQIRYKTIEFEKNGIGNQSLNLLDEGIKAVSLHFEGMIPGDKIYINDGIERENIGLNNNYKTGFILTIGSTGSYVLELNNNVEIEQVCFLSSLDKDHNDSDLGGIGMVQHQGTLTYGFLSKRMNVFDNIVGLTIEDRLLEQHIGNNTDILKNINDIRTSLQTIYKVHFSLREISNNETNVFKNPLILYANRISGQINSYYDPNTGETFTAKEYNPTIEYNGNIIDLSIYSEFTTYNLPEITTLKIGNGVIAEISYYCQVAEYQVETLDVKTKLAKSEWMEAYNNLLTSIWVSLRGNYPNKELAAQAWEDSIEDSSFFSVVESMESDIILYTKKEKEAYAKYIKELERALKEWEEREYDL